MFDLCGYYLTCIRILFKGVLISFKIKIVLSLFWLNDDVVKFSS